MRLKFSLYLVTWLLGVNISTFAFTTNDANTIFNSYSNAFYVLSGTNAWFKDNQTSGNNHNNATYFWGQANEVECVLDAYEWTSNSTYKPMISNLLYGFTFSNNNGTNWSWDPFNDDIMWACMAFARGYLDTGNTTFRDIAKFNFDLCYARGWDTSQGGMFWTIGQTNKVAAANGPAAIAAYLLYQDYNDTTYLLKATNIYNWERSNLFVPASGMIFDGMHVGGSASGGATTYNQGTFIGAANFLGLTNDAVLAANYTMNSMTTAGILPQYGTNNNNSGFNAIFFRWMARFMKTRGLQSNYQPWLQDNANAAWNLRRTSDNLSWCQWRQPTAAGVSLYSWDCIASTEALQVLDPSQSTSPGIMTLTNSDSSGATSFNVAGNWSNGTAPAWSNNCIVAGLGLRTPADSANHSFYGSSLILTNGGALRLTTASGGIITVGTSLVMDNGIVSAWTRPAVLNGNIILQNNGGVFDPQSIGGFTVTASIGGPGGLTLATDNDTFAGTLFLSGNNTYSGGTTINGPFTLTLTNFGTLGSSNAPLTFNNNGNGLTIPHVAYGNANYGTLNLNGVNTGVGNLAGGGGKILNNAGSGTIIFAIGNGNSGGGSYQGAIMDHTLGTGIIALVKTGSGNITLSGTNNFTGGTTIAGGTLQLGDELANNGSVVGNITNNAILIFANPVLQSYSGAISGTGSFVKTGNGTLTLGTPNTYTGSTTVKAGTLALNGSGSFSNSLNFAIAAGATLDVTGRSDQTLTLKLVQFNQQTLTGGGIINGNLTILNGSTVNPGDTIGTLTVQGNANLTGGTLIMELNRMNAQNSDQLVVTGAITAGNTLTVTNLGPALQPGDLFQLFNSPVAGFTTVNLPALTGANVWINRLGINGTIQVAVPFSTTPTNIIAQVVGSELALTWPTDHIGWRLQAQTNAPGAGIGTNWVEIFGSSTNDLLTMPIDPNNSSVFLRLIYP
jgi:autotransporter-associated beta strand protein